ncbi:DUF397 domain-containing protein [Streptomyces sp. NBC_01262]|jgi:hypothetical protein|uniref:DUF397 domain-containing protein n=1 Tax=Streptomyces sp. NBC_01262 TaxID=2903803 RepID=UPI002E2EED96|nr:DUF397 domain-containing protein [Streptomyces sp. NBC_01262]
MSGGADVSESTIDDRLAREHKPDLDLTNAEWLSTSPSTGDVQIAFIEGFAAMRDRRNPDGPALIFTPAEWRAFVLGARDGEFDLT